MRARKRMLAATSSLVALAALAVPAHAQNSVEAFYKGRTVELVVGTLPGGGYDLYGRLIARYLGKHIPGAPTVIVRNMPGAGHLRMANWLYNVAPRDGTVLATTPQSIAIEQALGTDGVQYDAGKFTYVGRAAPVVEVTYVWHTSKTQSIADARTRETVMGGSGAASPTVFYLKALNALAGTKFRVVAGFRGVSETELAVQREEVEGGTKAWASMKIDNAEWLREKKAKMHPAICARARARPARRADDGRARARRARDRGAETVRRRQRHGPLDLRDARHPGRARRGAAQGVHGYDQRSRARRLHARAQHRPRPRAQRRGADADRDGDAVGVAGNRRRGEEGARGINRDGQYFRTGEGLPAKRVQEAGEVSTSWPAVRRHKMCLVATHASNH